MNPITNSTSRAFLRWQPAAWLRVDGPDAAVFLQGQFTNDLAKMPQGGAAYGLWLNVKGKVLADSFVIRTAGPGGAGTAAAAEFWVGSYFSPAAIIQERLESFIIADDVTVEDRTSGWSGVTFFGAAAAAILATPPAEGFVFRGRRAAEESAEWVFPAATAAANVATRLGDATELSADDATRQRIEAGIPAVPQDIGPGDLPNEAGLDEVAISYTKGCYLGQEVMARLKSMGQVRRRLVRVRGAGAPPATLPTPLFAGAKQVGELRSAARAEGDAFVGLAMVSRLNVTRDTALALAPDAAATLTLRDVP